MSAWIKSNGELRQKIRSEQGVLVMFCALWCPFCLRFMPVYEKLAPASVCFRVSTDEIPSSEDEFGIEVVPTVLFFQNGVVTRRLDGAPGIGLNEEQLADMLASCGIGRHGRV